MAEEDHHQTEPSESCVCFSASHHFLGNEKDLGMDENFAQVSLLTCSVCGQQWLKYLYEIEAFTASGRWYLGAIDAEQASLVTADNAKNIMEELDWYFYGGSYYGGRRGRASGKIYLNP